MRVLLAAVSSAPQLSGVQRHAFNLAACLLTRPEISRVDLVLAPWQHQLAARHAPNPGTRLHLHAADLPRNSLAKNAWFFYTLPAVARQLQADLVHIAYPVPLRRDAFHCPVVVTLHDLYPYESPQNFGLTKAWINRRVLQQCMHNADAIACVSDATVDALRRFTSPHIWPKALRVYNCVQLACHEVEPSNLVPHGSPFLLCVAQHRYNKNIPLALTSFHHLLHHGVPVSDLRLVIIGIPGPETPRIYREISRLGITDRVVLVSGLSDGELLWCYRNCAVLLMPSLSEGFGLPAVEALMAGCRIVCSSIPALHEVGGTYCRFVSLKRSARDCFAQALVEELGRPVPAPVSFSQFSPATIGREYLGIYDDVLTCRSARPSTSLDPQMSSASSERPAL